MSPARPPVRRRRARSALRPRGGLRLLALAVLLVVAACTGTSEERTSLLLIVGIQEGGQSQLALLEDSQELSLSITERLNFVAGSARSLPAPAVSIDFTNRELERGTAFVLSRAGTGTGVEAYLHRFNVAGIDPAEPSAFAETGFPGTGGGPLTLTAPDGSGILDGGATGNSVVCPTAVRSNRAGTRLLLMDDPTACGSDTGGSPVLWLVNPAAGTAAVLEYRSDLLAAAPYTDQGFMDGGDSEEKGYYLEDAIDRLNVFAYEFEDARTDPFGEFATGVDPTRLQDMAGSFGTLVALVDDKLVGTDLGAEGSFGAVETVDEARRVEVVRTPRTGVTALVLSVDEVGVHWGLAGDSPDVDEVTFRGAAATIDGFYSFGYVMGEGELLVLDLLLSPGADETVSTVRVSVGELALAPDPAAPNGLPLGVISWVRAAEPPPTP